MGEFIKAFQQYPYLYITATYAAIISSIALTWDMVKHYQKKARLVVKATAGWKLGSGYERLGLTASQASANTYLTIRVVSRGGEVTTVKNIGLYFYRNKLMYWLNHPYERKILTLAVIGIPLPYTLEPGKEWTCFVEESADLKALAKQGISYIAIDHVMSNKEALGRVSGW